MCLRTKSRSICTSDQDLHTSYRVTRNNKELINQNERGKAILKIKNIEETVHVDNIAECPRYSLRSNSNINQDNTTKNKKVNFLRLENRSDTYLYPLIEKIQIADQNKFVKELHQVQASMETIESNISQSFLINTDQYKLQGIQISEIPSEFQGQNEKRTSEMYRIDIVEESKLDFNLNLVSNKENKYFLQHFETGYNPHSTNLIARRNTSTPKREDEQYNLSKTELMEYIPPITRQELFHSPHKRKSPVEIGVLRESVLAYGSRIEEDIEEALQREFDSITENEIREIPAKFHRSEISNSWSPLSSTNCEKIIIRIQRKCRTYLPNRREYRKEEMEFITKYEFRPHISNKLSNIWASSYAIRKQKV